MKVGQSASRWVTRRDSCTRAARLGFRRLPGSLDPPAAMRDNIGLMTYYHPTKLTALLLITMGRAESLDPPFLS